MFKIIAVAAIALFANTTAVAQTVAPVKTVNVIIDNRSQCTASRISAFYQGRNNAVARKAINDLKAQGYDVNVIKLNAGQDVGAISLGRGTSTDMPHVFTATC